jgi:hypothetical protein
MNIRHISFDRVVMKSKHATYVCYNAMVCLWPYHGKMMAGAAYVNGFSINNVQRPNVACEASYSFINWKVVSFDGSGMKIKCQGAMGDELVYFEIDCIYSLPLKDEE